MDSQIVYAAQSHTGLVRGHNEDAFLARPDLGLYIVADGMGGHDSGEVASRIAVETMEQAFSHGHPLEQTIELADSAIKQHAAALGVPTTMGTTVVTLRLEPDNYRIAWVGDSRAYLCDQSGLQQISKDHSYVQMLFDSGAITREQMATHTRRNVITQSLGAASEQHIAVDSRQEALTGGQHFLLCSDGLSDMVSDEDIQQVLMNNQINTDQKVNQLMQKALDNGGKDNVTVIIVSLPENLPAGALPPTSEAPHTTANSEKPPGLFAAVRNWFRSKH